VAPEATNVSSRFLLEFIPAQGAGAGMTSYALINVTLYKGFNRFII
jgi:hypothetical protein